MINIIIYLDSDGTITRCVSCPESMEDIQCVEGESWIQHDRVDDTIWRVNPVTKELEER